MDTQISPAQWKIFAEVYEPPHQAQLISPSLPKYSGTSKCFPQVLSTSEQTADSKIGSLTFQGNNIKVNKVIIPLLKKIDQEIKTENLNYKLKLGTPYTWRCVNSPKVNIVDKTTCLDNKGIVQRSKHSYGLAIDINPSTNPFCLVRPDGTNYYKTKEGIEVECKKYNGKYYDLPEEIIQIFKANDFRWGGDFSDAKDYMHFDWQGNLGDFKGNGNIEPYSNSK
ncbi:M15 family metallopeptidase [Candidatus Woesearchaeota archaeon]|nr:M15 family metallopeptidase [Candidatus Woesearchaeota archaeon]